MSNETGNARKLLVQRNAIDHESKYGRDWIAEKYFKLKLAQYYYKHKYHFLKYLIILFRTESNERGCNAIERATRKR